MHWKYLIDTPDYPHMHVYRIRSQSETLSGPKGRQQTINIKIWIIVVVIVTFKCINILWLYCILFLFSSHMVQRNLFFYSIMSGNFWGISNLCSSVNDPNPNIFNNICTSYTTNIILSANERTGGSVMLTSENERGKIKL